MPNPSFDASPPACEDPQILPFNPAAVQLSRLPPSSLAALQPVSGLSALQPSSLSAMSPPLPFFQPAFRLQPYVPALQPAFLRSFPGSMVHIGCHVGCLCAQLVGGSGKPKARGLRKVGWRARGWVQGWKRKECWKAGELGWKG